MRCCYLRFSWGREYLAVETADLADYNGISLRRAANLLSFEALAQINLLFVEFNQATIAKKVGYSTLKNY